MLETARDLDIEPVDKRDVHFRRDQRDRKLAIGREDGALATRVGRRARPHQIARIDEARYRISEGDCPIDMRIAIVELGFTPDLCTERYADIAPRESEQVALARLEIGERQSRLAEPVAGDPDGIKRRRIAWRHVETRRIGKIAAVKWIIGIGCRERQLAL